MTDHQKGQVDVINKIEKQVKNNSISFSLVPPVEDYENDVRMCLTSIHIPHQRLKSEVEDTLIKPLGLITPEYYYYSSDSLHMTIKNVRVINDPPNFTKDDIVKAEKVFAKVIPNHKQFQVYFYRLFLFPSNLTLISTTDEELDNIFFDLDRELRKERLPDDKNYVSPKYNFSNMTLARFNHPPTREFKQKVDELSKSLSVKPYTVDSVTLLTCNAVLKKRTIIQSWKLS